MQANQVTLADRCNEIWSTRQAFDRQPTYLVTHFATLTNNRNAVLASTRGYGLDVGAGMGADAAYLARRGYRMDCLEPSPVAARKLQAAADELGLPITTYQDTMATFRPNKTYDVALLIKLLHLLTPAQQAETLQSVEDHLKPDGQVVIRALTTLSAPSDVPGMLRPGELERKYLGQQTSCNIIHSQRDIPIPYTRRDGIIAFQYFDDIIVRKK